jgi:hypothetical protein
VTCTYYGYYIKWIANFSKDTNINRDYRTTNTIKEINILQSIKDGFDCSGM